MGLTPFARCCLISVCLFLGASVFAGTCDAQRATYARRIPVRKEAQDVPVSGATSLPTFAFPWPPPRSTAKFALPARLLVPDDTSTLGTAALAVQTALLRAGIEQWAVFTVGLNGFAFVTRLERTDIDGNPLSGANRWPEELNADIRQHTIGQYLRSLFVSEPGYYRVIAIVVTSRAVVDTGKPIVADSAVNMLTGPQHLPDWMLGLRAPGMKATALIYQFKSTTRDAKPAFLAQTSAPPVEQLARTHLWKKEELTRR